MLFGDILILICSVLLGVDILFSLYYFRYNFLLETKRRFAALAKIPLEYKHKLNTELYEEIGLLRRFVHASYITWYVSLLFTPMWFVAIIHSIIAFIINLFYKKPYIAPQAFLFSLLTGLVAFFFTILNLIFRFV